MRLILDYVDGNDGEGLSCRYINVDAIQSFSYSERGIDNKLTIRYIGGTTETYDCSNAKQIFDMLQDMHYKEMSDDRQE